MATLLRITVLNDSGGGTVAGLAVKLTAVTPSPRLLSTFSR